jgi:hypothetical protein
MKPKNDGQVLTVRISGTAHADIQRILAKWALDGLAPSGRTKANAVEMALKVYAQEVGGDAAKG